ncbi:DNA mismatch repair protein MutS [Desulfopila aestuarii]|uniref:DNA mismatch repair protein MutS n=1 Tax=Desulfopila aestuarii DSM 18488 TaxID=1121416 RepID=A0A1M7Y2G8_9BACT|nr:DNA mismatch repair protein MutS [Desulfopila aestuarii]SHO46148.1 DNA mismatch repair protein MutS [Desulfopila aestuarii DSM 18488]
MTANLKLTPMLQQYLEIKEQHNDTILFYRMGDFYEMFFDDAEIASKILSITLTSRNNKSDAPKVPMCGIPFHAAQGYLAKLVKAGRRVAICEQVENPAEAKGIVKREVVRIISPGVITEDGLLDDKNSNYVCAICRKEHGGQVLFGISFLEASTGEFLVGEFFDGEGSGESVLDQLTRLTPSEILISDGDLDPCRDLLEGARLLLPELCITIQPASIFQFSTLREQLLTHFGVSTLDGYGCSSFTQGIIAAGVLFSYLLESQKTSLTHITRLTPLNLETVLQIDDSSRRNLELTQTIIGGKREGSLLSVLDETCTPMGARMLKNNLLFPLQDPARINRRLAAVSFFYQNSGHRRNLRELLNTVYDLERLTSRMILGSGNGRDMLAMKQSLGQLPKLLQILSTIEVEKIKTIAGELDPLDDLHSLIESSINPEAPVTLRDGNLIREGYHQELDELIAIQRDGKQTIARLEISERESSGIAKLKVGFNKVFGYYFEVSKLQADKIPDHYIRKQTLVNAERFITPELKEFENKILGAEDRRLELEYQLFIEVRNHLVAQSHRLLHTATLLAQLDVLCALAEVAQRYNYCRPTITEDNVITISEGRHPVIERSLPAGRFVPNDVHLDQESQQLLIITGPNMAGKSTVLRQTALIVLLAQMGSFVPAAKASIGIVDRIFTRVGAMDDLRRGQSTFMVEMSETANILNNATPRSLVILDEIGRGTSTYDGLSIAWAVAEDLVQKNELGVKTMFATHYHELTDLARTHDRVRNFSIAVREWNDSIIFLHKLIEGGANRSYGIQVAALAGVPNHVVERAEEILNNIERGEFDHTGQPAIAKSTGQKKKRIRTHPDQLSLFQPPSDPVRDYLRILDADQLSPREALEILYKLKDMMGNN